MNQITILLADNDPDSLTSRQRFLENEGYRVIIAQDLAAARGELGQSNIDLAVLDLHMINDADEKDASGFVLARIAFKQEIPCILLVDLPSVEIVRELVHIVGGEDRHFIDLVTKTEGTQGMLNAVERAIASSRPSLRPLLAMVLLFGTVLVSATGIVLAVPYFLIGSVVLAILFTCVAGTMIIA